MADPTVTLKMALVSKPENSTYRPPSFSKTLTGQIKRVCSKYQPIIDVQQTNAINPTIYNYFYIEEFSRYYFLRDIEYIMGGIWRIYLECDVMASYKENIGNANLYVLRAAAEYDGTIVDNLYPVKSEPTFNVVTKITPWNLTLATGFYVIGIASKTGGSGPITYYAVSASNMATLITNLMNDTIISSNGFDIADASLQLQKSLIDPLQYIKSCIYIPGTISVVNGTLRTSINIFDYTINCSAYELSELTWSFQEDFAISQHPNAATRGAFLNHAPYTIMTLYAAPFGVLELDTSVYGSYNGVNVDVIVDLPTGEGTLNVGVGAFLTNTLKAQVGVPVQLSQVTRNMLGAANNILGSVGSVLSGNPMGVAAGIGNAVQSLAPRSNTIGGIGSFSGLLTYNDKWELVLQHFIPVDDDAIHHGRPLCKNRNISTMSGYMIVQDGDIGCDGTLEESRKIKEILETGFYYQ